MTGGIFRKDESALRRAEQKPRLSWGRDVWIALVAYSHLERTLSDPRKDHGDIIGAYLIVVLASRDSDFQDVASDKTISKPRVMRAATGSNKVTSHEGRWSGCGAWNWHGGVADRHAASADDL